MLIRKDNIYRNIDEKFLAEYREKGYVRAATDRTQKEEEPDPDKADEPKVPKK